MHAVKELLPIICGFVIALLFVLTKPFAFKNIILILSLVASAVAINQLNGEGNEQMAVDVLLSVVGALPCLIVGKYRTWIK